MIDSTYSNAVTKRFDRPSHAGPPGAVAAGVGRAGTLASGAVVEISLQIEAGRVRAGRFRAFGCPHTIAAASLLAERIEGRLLAALDEPCTAALAAELEVPAHKLGRLLLVEDALAAAVADCRARQAGALADTAA
jgi:NifU-like protein involved in Fe-S cluster formation